MAPCVAARRVFPLIKGGSAKRLGVVFLTNGILQNNPLKAFAFFPPLIRGIFEDDE
jgi:hypothetical protein